MSLELRPARKPVETRDLELRIGDGRQRGLALRQPAVEVRAVNVAGALQVAELAAGQGSRLLMVGGYMLENHAHLRRVGIDLVEDIALTFGGSRQADQIGAIADIGADHVAIVRMEAAREDDLVLAGDELCLTVADRGPGFQSPPPGAGADGTTLGLAGLADRVESLGGHFAARNRADGGAELVMTLDLRGL